MLKKSKPVKFKSKMIGFGITPEGVTVDINHKKFNLMHFSSVVIIQTMTREEAKKYGQKS